MRLNGNFVLIILSIAMVVGGLYLLSITSAWLWAIAALQWVIGILCAIAIMIWSILLWPALLYTGGAMQRCTHLRQVAGSFDHPRSPTSRFPIDLLDIRPPSQAKSGTNQEPLFHWEDVGSLRELAL